MNSLKSLIAGITLFAVLAGLVAVPADAAPDRSRPALDRTLAETQRLVAKVLAHPDVSEDARNYVTSEHAVARKGYAVIVAVDREILRRIEKQRAYSAQYAKYARLYNANRHHLSAARAQKMYALLTWLRAEIQSYTADLNKLHKERFEFVGALTVALEKFNGGLREALEESPIS